MLGNCCLCWEMVIRFWFLKVFCGFNKNEVSEIMRMDFWFKNIKRVSKCMVGVWLLICVEKWLVIGKGYGRVVFKFRIL